MRARPVMRHIFAFDMRLDIRFLRQLHSLLPRRGTNAECAAGRSIARFLESYTELRSFSRPCSCLAIAEYFTHTKDTSAICRRAAEELLCRAEYDFSRTALRTITAQPLNSHKCVFRCQSHAYTSACIMSTAFSAGGAPFDDVASISDAQLPWLPSCIFHYHTAPCSRVRHDQRDHAPCRQQCSFRHRFSILDYLIIRPSGLHLRQNGLRRRRAQQGS